MSIESKYLQEQRIDIDLRYETDFITDAAEVLYGSMRTPTEYSFDYENQEIIASDGSSLREIMSDSVDYAEDMVRTKPQLKFELRRRHKEYEEYQEMLQMMNGTRPNTMIVVSDFPPELMSYPRDVGGYNVSRRQTFLRVIQKKADGTMQMYSQNLDGSNRKALESIYRYNGYIAEEGELLGQRIHIDTDVDAADVTDNLMNVYDNSLEEQTGLEYRAGLLSAHDNIENTIDFVKAQEDLIAEAKKNKKEGTYEANRYNIMALLTERLSNISNNNKNEPELFLDFTTKTKSVPGFMINNTFTNLNLQSELKRAGSIASSKGEDFSSCGFTSSSGNKSIESEFNDAGYGNKTESSSEDYSFDSYQYCVSCQAPPKDEKEKKQWCGPCGLCRGCDKKAGGKG